VTTLEQELRLGEQQRHSCYDQACRLENFAATFEAERDLLHQGRIESAAAVEAAWCVFRLCVEAGGLPDWFDVLYWAERSPVTQGMVRAVLLDVDANLTMSDETFEERMGPFDDVLEPAERANWQKEGF
jgi:hypothetical protein